MEISLSFFLMNLVYCIFLIIVFLWLQIKILYTIVPFEL